MAQLWIEARVGMHKTCEQSGAYNSVQCGYVHACMCVYVAYVLVYLLILSIYLQKRSTKWFSDKWSIKYGNSASLSVPLTWWWNGMYQFLFDLHRAMSAWCLWAKN